MLIVSLLFLAVCAVNLVGLLLGKFLARAGEVGVRRALGASRADIFLQHVVECELVALVGGAIGLLLSLGALAAMNAWLKTTRRAETSSTSTPRWSCCRSACRSPPGSPPGSTRPGGPAASLRPSIWSEQLKEAPMEFGPILRSMRRNKVRYGLIVAEVALTLAIVANCVNMIGDARAARWRRLGLRRRQHPIRAEHARSLRRSRRTATSTTRSARTSRSLRALPGVKAASNTRFLPWQGGGSSMESRVLGSKGEMLRNQVYNADEATLETLGSRLIEGRNFTREEVEADTKRLRDLTNSNRPRGADGQPIEKISQDIIISKAFGELLFAGRQGARQAPRGQRRGPVPDRRRDRPLLQPVRLADPRVRDVLSQLLAQLPGGRALPRARRAGPEGRRAGPRSRRHCWRRTRAGTSS